jgi:hypothetical protein
LGKSAKPENFFKIQKILQKQTTMYPSYMLFDFLEMAGTYPPFASQGTERGAKWQTVPEVGTYGLFLWPDEKNFFPVRA